MKVAMDERRIEQLANEVRSFLEQNELWSDIRIYFNDRCYDSEKKETLENIKARDYLEYAASEHILSMSFEGPLYDIINYGECDSLLDKFDKIFEKYGLYYELGHAWNLTCYPR